ncbi:hypothetical protein FDF76_03330 [Clostridium botulinum]|nr:hypothetical protein [Clostridium botulinum]NFI49648.1 hypothetical protein [Clostridium botulinum]NFI58578.1 hypothetical protein [Clostridium botulinum]NFI69381.1 hypothetical protein [Clostridium botulinum]NFI87142.1 hypothetical protein [Clostridium botulinum]
MSIKCILILNILRRQNMIDKNLLDSLIKHYEDCFKKNDNENTVEERVVIPFLEYIGYKKEWGTPQQRIDIKNTCDRLICSPNGNKLIVEIKRARHKLNVEDKEQVLRYLNNEAVEWGILTNGNEYLLVNHMLNDLKPIDRYCLRYDLKRGKFHPISKNMNDLFFYYFTYDYIFNRKASNFFAEFQRFKVNSLNTSSIMSLKQYESANFNFFDYLTNDINAPVCLNDLNSRNLIKYFKTLLETKKLSKSTIINKFRYIKSFVDFLEKEDILVNKNDFSKITEDVIIEGLDLISEEKEIQPITLDEISSLLKLQESDTKNGLRNILVIQLICYLGLSRESIINIKDSDITSNYKTPKCKLPKNITYYIKLNNMCIKLPKSMNDNLSKYIKQRKKAKLNFNNFFYSQYTIDNEKFRPLSLSTINQIINESFNKTYTISEERRKSLNYSLLRASVIKLLYENNFSLEEISQFTSLTIDSIYKSLSNSKTLALKINKIPNKLFINHPFNKILF